MSLDTEAVRRFTQRAEQAEESSAFLMGASPVNTALSRSAEEESSGEAELLTIYCHLNRSPMFRAMLRDYRIDRKEHRGDRKEGYAALMLLCARMYRAGQAAEERLGE